LLHHPFHQPQHLCLHPHHHWSYMQHRKLEFGKKHSPLSPCWIL
jgi:hypothetical protein